MQYKAILRTGYDGWNVTYTEFTAPNKFKAFEKLLQNFTTVLDAEAIQEENITDYDTLLDKYAEFSNAGYDGGYDEILFLFENNNIVFQSEFGFVKAI